MESIFSQMYLLILHVIDMGGGGVLLKKKKNLNVRLLLLYLISDILLFTYFFKLKSDTYQNYSTYKITSHNKI